MEARVQPKAKREGIELGADGTVLLRVAAPPEKGKANRACIELLARALRVPRGAVTLVRGERSRDKAFAIEGLTPEEAIERLRRMA